MARLRRKHRQQNATHAPGPARRTPIQRAEAHPLEAQQHALGNQAVQRLIDSHAVQPKLTVGAPNDSYEQEADRVANQVMGAAPPTTAGSEGAQSIQRMEADVHREGKDKDEKKPESKGKESGKKEGGKEAGGKEGGKDKKKEDDKAKRKPIMDDEKKEEEPVQREAEETAVPDVSPALEASLDAQSGGGAPMPDSLQSFFEPRIGADLSDVRLHTDQRAAEAAAELEAQAFTRDRDVYFGAGYFEPQSSRGRWLLAHELTHTVQQTRQPGAPEHDPQSGVVEAPFTIEVPRDVPLLVARKEDEEEPPRSGS